MDHFVKKYCEENGKTLLKFSPEAMQLLLDYDWPGNVRELENTIEYAVALTQQDIITEDFILENKVPFSGDYFKPLKEAKDEFEKIYLIHLLDLCEGHVTKAAKLAGKYRADFYDLLKKHNLKVGDYKTSPQ